MKLSKFRAPVGIGCCLFLGGGFVVVVDFYCILLLQLFGMEGLGWVSSLFYNAVLIVFSADEDREQVPSL